MAKHILEIDLDRVVEKAVQLIPVESDEEGAVEELREFFLRDKAKLIEGLNLDVILANTEMELATDIARDLTKILERAWNKEDN